MELGLLHDFIWDFFPHETKNIIFVWKKARDVDER